MNLIIVVGICFVLLVLGTILGRYYTPDQRPLRRAAEEGKAYARGIVELLEGDDDAAIKEISGTLKQNSRTVEAFFALGTLFRNRGEFERAVRVHQTILMRRDVDKKIKLRAHYQLALDFDQAGFPRRAVKALEHVITRDKKHVNAFRQLARLYEGTDQWERAAGAHRRVGKLTKEDTTRRQAHMLVALASVKMADGDMAAAGKNLRRAISISADSVHALHYLAMFQREKGNLPAAAKVWEKAIRLRPNLASFFAPRLEKALFEVDRLETFDRLLQELMDSHPDNVHLRLAYARFDAKRNPERAMAQLTALLDQAPTLIPARREAARLVLQSGEPAQIRQAFEELLELLARADRGFRCNSCGHATDALFWRCPACSAWDSVRVAWGRRSGERAA